MFFPMVQQINSEKGPEIRLPASHAFSEPKIWPLHKLCSYHSNFWIEIHVCIKFGVLMQNIGLLLYELSEMDLGML